MSMINILFYFIINADIYYGFYCNNWLREKQKTRKEKG